MNKNHLPEGCKYLPQFLSASVQTEVLNEIRTIVSQAPLYTPHMQRTGKPFSVAMTNCGPLGWVSDKEGGYRYEPVHPVTGKAWPPIPGNLIALWSELAGFSYPPQACLVNYYSGRAKLGLHRDEDESDFSAPILSVSLGDSAIFRIGGLRRRDPTQSLELKSGDVLVMGGASRLRYHGIDRLFAGTSDLLAEGGRFNLTMRYVGG